MRAWIDTKTSDPEELARTARAILEALLPLARTQVRTLPPLLTSGVVYGVEEGAELFTDPQAVYRKGFGDCANLTLWHVAELRERGVPAAFKVYKVANKPNGGRLWHVQTRLPNGTFFDASDALGMRAVLAAHRR